VVKQGDIIWVNFDPHLGTEQAGARPAMVVSGSNLNKVTQRRVWVCPISKTDKNYPIHIRLTSDMKTAGVVLCDQIKTIDLVARGYRFIEAAPDYIVWDVMDIIAGLME